MNKKLVSIHYLYLHYYLNLIHAFKLRSEYVTLISLLFMDSQNPIHLHANLVECIQVSLVL